VNGLVLIASALAIFIVAALGILGCAVLMFRMAGTAMNPKRPVNQRRVRGLLAALSLAGILASATAGYLGITTLLYFGMKAAA
jgi:hypothetical protein